LNIIKIGKFCAKFLLEYYVNGIGTENNKEKGFELYNKVAGYTKYS